MNDSFASDITFVIGSDQKEFSGNRMLLAAISDVFKAMLFGSMAESKADAVITIEDIDPKGFQSVLNYAHCKDPAISIKNVVSVKEIARRYQIHQISELCDQHFSSSLNPINFCSFFVQSLDHKLDEYVQKCIASLDGNMRNQIYVILGSDGFMEMGLKAMQSLLQLDNLCIGEQAIWNAVLKWTEKQCTVGEPMNEIDAEPPTKRRKLNNHNNPGQRGGDQLSLLQSVVPFIRFGLMEHRYFVQNVQTTGCLSKDEMLTISNYIAMRDINPQFECGRFSTKMRTQALDLSIRRFDLYSAASIQTLNGGLEIKGKRSIFCGGYLVYPQALEPGGYTKGRHVWSVQVVHDSGCGHSEIGVVSTRLNSNSLNYPAAWPPSVVNQYGSYSSTASTSTSHFNPPQLKNGDIITVVLDCDEGMVYYWINNEKMAQKDTIDKGIPYFFAMRLCAGTGHHHFRTVKTPANVLRLCR